MITIEARRRAIVGIAAAGIQYCGWVILLSAVALVVLVGSARLTGFRYNGF